MENLLFRPQYLERKHIEETLEVADQIPLVIMVAPTGYGKTTVTQNFLDKMQGIKIWLPFGQNEVDSGWIWMRLCDKMEEKGYSFVHALRKNKLPVDRYEVYHVIDLIKDAFEEPCYLIFDDCHECENDDLLLLLEAVIYAKIRNLHIILLSRTYIRIPYEEMWMKGYCILLEQSCFALSQQEMEEYFLMNGVILAEEEKSGIYEYTEGWMPALYLILIDYKKNGEFRNMGGINNLTRRLIFENISDKAKKILMELSLFDLFTEDQAVYITQMESCRYILPELAENIGFLKYDISTKCYSMHAVLRTVASTELEKSGIDKMQLYGRGGGWYEKNNSFIYAIRCYRRAGDNQKIFDIIEECHCSTLYECAPEIITRFFDGLKREEKLERPLSYIPYIGEIIVYNDIVKGRRLYEEAVEYYKTHECKGISQKQLLGELYLVQWNLEFNDLEKMTECAKKAYELMENKRSAIFHSDEIMSYGTPELLFLYHNKEGGLKKIVEQEKLYTYYYMHLIKGYQGGWDQLFEAEYCFTKGELKKADQLAKIVCEKAVLRQQSCIIISGYFLRMRCQIHFGRKELFEQLMIELDEQMKNEIRSTILVDYDIARGYLHGCILHSEKMKPWLLNFDLNNCNRIVRSTRSGCISYGISLMQNGEWVRLENLAEEMGVPYSNSRHVYVSIYTELCYAISRYHLYGMDQGIKHLKRGFAIAREDEIRMPFVENIIYLEPILIELAEEDTYAADILEMGQQQKKGIAAINSMEILVKEELFKKELITGRELELMLLVAQGDKNTEIGEKMSIALVTVEKKLTSIYRKLGVSNRAAAISKLRELQLIH